MVRGRRSKPLSLGFAPERKGGVDWDLLSCVGSNPPFVPNPKAEVPDEAASTIQPIDGSPSHRSKNHQSVDPTGWRWETKGGMEPSQKEPPTTVRAGGRRGEGGGTRPDQTWVWRIAPGVSCPQPEGLGLGIVPRRKETEEEEDTLPIALDSSSFHPEHSDPPFHRGGGVWWHGEEDPKPVFLLQIARSSTLFRVQTTQARTMVT